jgi:hypothetical protein
VTKDQTNRKYFVYCIKNKGIPFYVGMSRRQDRFDQHINGSGSPREQTKKRAIISSILADGRRPEFETLYDNLSAEEASSIEIKSIASFGRQIDGGCLVNVSLGGGPIRPFLERHKRSLALNADQLAYLDTAAKHIGISVSEFLRRIIDEYREKKS